VPDLGLAALLIVGGALAHAAWNLVIKATGASGPHVFTMALAVSVVALAPFGVPSLWASAPAVRGWVAIALGSALLHVAYFLLLQRGYRLADVGVVYPLARGTGPFLSVVGAVAVLGERPGIAVAVGAGLVVLGVVVVGTAGSRQPDTADGARRRTGVAYGLAVGVLIAGYTLWDAAAVTTLGFEPVGYFWASLVGQLAVFAALSARRPMLLMTAVRRHPGAVVAIGVLSPLAYLAILVAYGLAPVSIVAPARELSVVLVALAGWWLFHEPHPVRRAVGSVIVLAGVVVLASS
jgi:drug/metabolite transporter (DMT)-like permease